MSSFRLKVSQMELNRCSPTEYDLSFEGIASEDFWQNAVRPSLPRIPIDLAI